MAELPPYDAILLTGGRGRRLGGVDKAGVAVGGRPLVARVAAAAAGACRLVVVGPRGTVAPLDLHPHTVVTNEEPSGTGPCPAIAAGLAYVTAPHVAVLACDLPFLTADDLTALRVALEASPGAAATMPVDEAGRDQPLCSLWRSAALAHALARLGDAAANAPVRALVALAGEPVRIAPPRTDTGGRPPPWFDCDTPEDLARAERSATGPTLVADARLSED